MRPTQLSSIDLNLLAVADALLETGSVTETAALVHLSQPAVSRSLSRLREQLSDELLVREGRGMVRTPFAEQLRPRLRKVLLDLERTLLLDEAFDSATAVGAITVASSDYASVAFIPQAVRRLSREAPQISLAVVPYREPFEPLLESGECDLVVGNRPSSKTWIASEQLFSTDWSCVAMERHPWLDDRSLDGFCSAKHILVSPTGQGGGPVDIALDGLGRRRQVAARVPGFAGALALAAQSDLLLVVPKQLADAAEHIMPLTCTPLPFAMRPSVVFISWHAARTDDPRTTWARQMVVQVIDEESRVAE